MTYIHKKISIELIKIECHDVEKMERRKFKYVSCKASDWLYSVRRSEEEKMISNDVIFFLLMIKKVRHRNDSLLHVYIKFFFGVNHFMFFFGVEKK